ncbi:MULTISPECIES: sigma-70 family RNA polymerase sigma factor [Mycolicibacterium]|uniref:sigma-70 family RNA polymerase sigma factor n=1 Tax=Mycolicibacterium TaxID=1866885 RepID=UPI0003059896|nr:MULTISPECIES: sigma-70 family RNA polymerase sigma factor [Mycolicibacterium]
MNNHGAPPPDRPDATRFVDTVSPCIEQIRGRARRLTTNPYDAEDLLQDTMLKAFSGFHTFQPDSNARAWLFRIMYNNWVNTYRARQRSVAEQLCEDFTDWQLSAEACHTSTGLRSAEVEALEAIRDDEVADALRAIPAVNRVTVYLADVEGYAYREIAALMGTPVGTVMSRLARGRRRLRELLNDVAKDRGIIRSPADGQGPLELAEH